MFYSRPAIEPLAWDLTDWPAPNGSRYFDAPTPDRRPVSIRFGGGWLTVKRGPKNASLDCPDMEEILCVRIAPFGTMDSAGPLLVGNSSTAQRSHASSTVPGANGMTRQPAARNRLSM